MARRTGTVKLSIVTAYDDRGEKQAERALANFQKKFKLATDSHAMDLARQSTALDKWATDFESKYTKAGDKIQAAGKAMSKTGDMLTKSVTVPMLAVGAAAFKAATDWESAFAGVEKTVDGTTEQMDALKLGIRNMARELPASRESIAGVAAAAGQLGIETDNVLAFTRVMVDLGQSTNLAAEEGATALARLANITGMSQKDFDRLGSSIVALGNNMATTESEIASMGMRIAGAGKQIGMTEPQIMGLAAALSSVGIEAEAGGSAISKTMIKIDSTIANSALNTKQYAKEFGVSMDVAKKKVGENDAALKLWAQTAGMSAKEFADAWKKDPAAALNSVITGLGKMEEQGGSTLLQLEKLGITELRQRDALLRMAGAGDLVTEALKISTGAWKDNTALADEAAKRYATTASQMAITKNRVTDAAVSLGEGLAPAVMKAADAAAPLLDWVKKQADAFAAMEPKQQEQIIKWAAIAAVMGPVLSVTGRMVTAVGGMVKMLGHGVAALVRWRAQMIANQAVEAAQVTSFAGMTKSAKGLGIAFGALKVAGPLAAAAVAKFAWDKLSPEAEKYAEAVRDGTKAQLTFGEVAAAPISAMAYAWNDAKAAADKYNKTGEKTFKWTDAIRAPISSLFYGISLLTGGVDKNAAATDKNAAAAQKYAEALRGTTAATYAAIDAQLEAENADIALERAKFRLTDAQKAVTAAIKEFGPESREATDAALDLRQADVDLEAAQRRAGDAQLALNTAMSQVPRPKAGDMQGWVDYYKAIGDQAGYAAAKANAANTTFRNGNAPSRSAGRNIPVYGSGGKVNTPHMAIVGDEEEYIINPRHPSALGLLDRLIADMGGLGRFSSGGTQSSSRNVNVSLTLNAPGADATTVAGLKAGGTNILAALARELRLA